MELHSLHRIIHTNHLGEEKQQMLNLNRRLETYLNRVKLLEEENMLLAKEIQAMRHNDQGALTRRKGLEEELRQARLEVDAVWRDRVLTELEVGKLTEELQALDLQRRREAEAQVKAKTILEQSRKELEEEQRAHIWLREKANQLEHEMRLVIQTHKEDVVHLEATLTHSRATLAHTFAQKGNQTPNLLQLGNEYSQRATQAWQEAADDYQGQLTRLEESLNQARSRLTQVGQQKREGQLKLQALEKEITSAQEVRQHLEKTVAQQKDKHSQEIQQLQEHLEALELEKQELGEQIDHIVMENRCLLQLKMSLGLEVATYRALLDSESLRGDMSVLNQPRNISITDAVFSPQGVKKNYQTQLSASHKTTSLSSVRIAEPTVMSATSVFNRKAITSNEMPKILGKPADTDVTKGATWETPYPKIMQDGAVENFRPQEVCEKVTYAEPLLPPNEPEAIAKTPSGEGEEDWNNVDVEGSDKRPVVESVVSCRVESALSTEQSFIDELGHHQFTTPSHTQYHANVTEEPCNLPDESDQDVALIGDAGKEYMQQAPFDTWVKEESINKDVGHIQQETSDSETEAVLEPTPESRSSSPESECEPAESVFNQVLDEKFDENFSNDGDPVDIKQEISCSMVGTNQMDVEDKLYPDGEEMDTWDSVIEKKIDVKRDDGITNEEGKGQHAEPEEDISAREQANEQRGRIMQDFASVVQQDNNVTSSLIDTQADDREHTALEQELVPPPDNEGDDEEDSQNVSMSWRTELEGDSYAQDNTLADTRPLIRYKSDETDANTQASHMDESESSEGEQERKSGETGTGTWSESKSKKFGTMEDLCEEVEGETMDDEYNVGYTHIKDGDDDGTTVSEHAIQVNDKESAEEMIRDGSEGHSDEETEELTEHMAHTNVDYDEELETDKLVEQELENLCTDSYSAHFAQEQDSDQLLHLKDKSVQEMTEEEEDMSSCEPGMMVNHELVSSTTIIDQTSENPCFSDSSDVMLQIDTIAVEDIQCEDQEAKDTPVKREEEDEPNVSMVMHADVTEDQSGFSEFLSRPEMEEINNSEDPNSVLLVTADEENVQDNAAPTQVKEVLPLEATSQTQEHVAENVEECQELPEAEWEVLENPRPDFDVRDQIEHDEKCEKVPETTNEASITHQEEPLEIPPESTPDENAIFKAKDATNNGLNGFFSSGVKNDFWVSSLESGATCEPDHACNEAAEQANENLGFADNLVWEITESQNVFNGKSRVDIDSSKALTTKSEQEQMHKEVKQVLCRNVSEGELVHSEESEVEAELWSSGEEPA